MAICNKCNQEMANVIGCTVTVVTFQDQTKLPAIVNNKEDVCHDCNAPRGTFHHEGCDMEECPWCGDQLIMCFCHSGVQS